MLLGETCKWNWFRVLCTRFWENYLLSVFKLLDGGAAPNVDLALSTSPTAVKPVPVKKSTIGSKKPAGKKAGMGAKKGLGAQKVGRDFADIEKEAEMADQIVSSRMDMAKVGKVEQILA